uniref:Uncharacterized protein n=1 Tax=Hyaloperonospora arabidopsidis (strain Emoy2) TaxID=559515 RepID=M4BH94_HYAAE
MTTIFDGYDEEYRTLTTDISTKLREIASFSRWSWRLPWTTAVDFLLPRTSILFMRILTLVLDVENDDSACH